MDKKDIDSVISAAKAGKMFKHNDIKFDDWIPIIYKKLKSGTHFYCMTNARNIKDIWDACERAGFKFVNMLAWVKNNKTPNKYYMQQIEFILLFRKGKARSINDMGSSTYIPINNIKNKKHPTEKPVELMEHFITNSSNENDVILDPFMGAGSTGLACINTNRNFIGIELDKEYFDIAKDRIETAQQSLF